MLTYRSNRHGCRYWNQVLIRYPMSVQSLPCKVTGRHGKHQRYTFVKRPAAMYRVTVLGSLVIVQEVMAIERSRCALNSFESNIPLRRTPSSLLSRSTARPGQAVSLELSHKLNSKGHGDNVSVECSREQKTVKVKENLHVSGRAAAGSRRLVKDGTQ